MGVKNMEIYFFQDISPVQFFETKAALYKHHAIYFPDPQLAEENPKCFASLRASGPHGRAETLVTSDQATTAQNEYDASYGRYFSNLFERPTA